MVQPVRNPTAAAQIAAEVWVRSLTQELLYAAGAAIIKRKKKKKESSCSGLGCCRGVGSVPTQSSGLKDLVLVTNVSWIQPWPGNFHKQRVRPYKTATATTTKNPDKLRVLFFVSCLHRRNISLKYGETKGRILCFAGDISLDVPETCMLLYLKRFLFGGGSFCLFPKPMASRFLGQSNLSVKSFCFFCLVSLLEAEGYRSRYRRRPGCWRKDSRADSLCGHEQMLNP